MSDAPTSCPEPLGAAPFSFAGPCERASVAPYCDRVRRLVGRARFDHIERVTAVADAIASANRFDRGERRATVLAAVLHDVARDLPRERLVELAPPEYPIDHEEPLALHGRAGRAIAIAWGVIDERVLDAIEFHVSGPRFGDRVAMAVYVADVSEPGRGVNDDVRELAMVDLARAYRRALERKVRYLRSHGKPVHPRTLKVHDELRAATA